MEREKIKGKRRSMFGKKKEYQATDPLTSVIKTEDHKGGNKKHLLVVWGLTVKGET